LLKTLLLRVNYYTMLQNELTAKEWIKKAGEDELSINAIIKNEGGAPSTACFLSQQAAEK